MPRDEKYDPGETWRVNITSLELDLWRNPSGVYIKITKNGTKCKYEANMRKDAWWECLRDVLNNIPSKRKNRNKRVWERMAARQVGLIANRMK